jgi:hypothetical protein
MGRMAEYRHGAHSVFEIHLHLVWVTKYRKPVLAGAVGVRVRDLIREICGASDLSFGPLCHSGERSEQCLDAFR